MPDLDLNPDGPHSPAHTFEAGQLFDDCSRFLVYATMARKGGLVYPADAYRLLGDVCSATGRLSQMCEQLTAFLQAQEATGRLYEARDRDIAGQVGSAADSLQLAGNWASSLTTVLQNAQRAINGLGVKDDPDA